MLEVAVLGPVVFDLTHIRAQALVDTGATTSGIGARIINELALTSYGKRFLKSATDEGPVSYYLFRIGLFESIGSEPADAVQLPHIFPGLDGFSWSRHADFDVILGMDVLRHCDFSMTRDGRCVLSFG